MSVATLYVSMSILGAKELTSTLDFLLVIVNHTQWQWCLLENG